MSGRRNRRGAAGADKGPANARATHRGANSAGAAAPAETPGLFFLNAGTSVGKIVRRTGAAVPAMVTAAVAAYATYADARAAVLGGWCGLAGIGRWTPAMVTRVEREMRRK